MVEEIITLIVENGYPPDLKKKRKKACEITQPGNRAFFMS